MARPEPCGLEVRDSGWKRRGQTCCIPSSPGGDSAGGAKCSSGLSGGQRRRLLHMSLKLSERLGEEDYRRVAVATGCDPAWLLNCWQQLRLGCTEQRERRAAFQARRDRAWFKIRCLQYRLRLHLDDEERRVAERQLGMWRRRYEHARRILDRMQFGPTHADIAKVLAVPKGTVDSSVFYGKRELRDPAYVATLASAVSNP